MNALQEEITQKTLALCVETGKMTAQLLQQAMKKVLADMEKHKNDPRLHHGKQTIRQLMPIVKTKSAAGISWTKTPPFSATPPATATRTVYGSPSSTAIWMQTS